MEKWPDLSLSMYQRARCEYQYLQAVCYVDVLDRHSHHLDDKQTKMELHQRSLRGCAVFIRL